MKIYELDLKDNKEYIDEDGKKWIAKRNTLFAENEEEIVDFYHLAGLMTTEFKEIPKKLGYLQEVLKENNYGKCPFCGSKNSAVSHENHDGLVDKKKCLVCKEKYTLIMQPVIYEVKRGW